MNEIFFHLSLFLLILAGCSHSLPDLIHKPVAVLRFQNMVGLQTQPTGCSLGGLGGLSTMEDYAVSHPVDLSFQVGPAFSPLINGPFSDEELSGERKRLWESWKKQGVLFYSVDAEDLFPSTAAFLQSAGGSSIPLLSTNIVDAKTKEPLFKTDWMLRIGGKSVWVLSLTEVKKLKSDFEVLSPKEAFSKKLLSIPKEAEGIVILGALSKETRKALSQLGPKPLLFLGGTFEEKNTTQIEKAGQKAFFGRSPAFGTGFSEIVLGNFEKDAFGKKPQVSFGSLQMSLYSDLLSEKKKGGSSCVPSSAQH